jgi:hypothetical protein
MNPAKITHLSLTSKLRRFDRFTINIFFLKKENIKKKKKKQQQQQQRMGFGGDQTNPKGLGVDSATPYDRYGGGRSHP